VPIKRAKIRTNRQLETNQKSIWQETMDIVILLNLISDSKLLKISNINKKLKLK